MDSTITFTVNGQSRTVTTDPQRPLLDVLREDLRLTGTKYGCGEGQCGACTVLVDQVAARACTLDVETLDGAAVTTVEGLASQGRLHAVQVAFVEARSLQCGDCTPGMEMSVVALLARDATPDDAAIREGRAGNICRGGGYSQILQAVHAAAAAMQMDTGLLAAPRTIQPAGALGDTATEAATEAPTQTGVW